MFLQVRALKRKVRTFSILSWSDRIAIIKQRLQFKKRYALEKQQVLARTAHSTWPSITDMYKLPLYFADYWNIIETRLASFNHEFLLPRASNRKATLKLADEYAQNYFDVLGSSSAFCGNPINWHTDIRMYATNAANKDNYFESHIFYKDIAIKAGLTNILEKDIKVVWELSRFQHVGILGQAYIYTNKTAYADAFKEHINSWITNNYYMLGPNWLCPMEVALRAINWIWGYLFFKDCSALDNSFWQQFICSLYDHWRFIEANLELYDGRTNNHYLSNLVGYLYLSWFFKDLPNTELKIKWCVKELLKEVNKQILADSTSYEGSTHYHILVTELLYHVLVICKELSIELPEKLHEVFADMLSFIQVCCISEKPNTRDVISIGDNDSGRVLYWGLPNYVITSNRFTKNDVSEIYTFDKFGISIIKNETWHISLRHHAYTHKQPNGHFHNDVGSITLAVHTIPIFVDPGSYVYTASSLERNAFRSIRAHNSFFIQDHEPVPIDNNLFVLDIPEYIRKKEKNSFQQIETIHDLYNRFGLRASRTVTLVTNSKIVITDRWLSTSEENIAYRANLNTSWNFTLHPDLSIHKTDKDWYISLNNKKILKFSCDFNPFSIVDGWVSKKYGSKEPTKKLVHQMPLETSAIYTITLTIIN